MWQEAELKRLPKAYESSALPTELPCRIKKRQCTGGINEMQVFSEAFPPHFMPYKPLNLLKKLNITFLET